MKKTIAVCILALAVALSGCGLLQNMPKPPQTTDVPVSAEPVSETPQQGAQQQAESTESGSSGVPAPVPATEPVTAAEPVPAAESKPAGQGMFLHMERNYREAMDPADGTVKILDFAWDTVRAESEVYPDAAARITETMAARLDTWYTGTGSEEEGSIYGYDTMLGLAEDQYTMARENSFDPVELSSTLYVSALRSDEAICVLEELDYVYLGGAHGSYSSEALCFDAQTGDLLSLDDLSADPEALRTRLVEEMLRLAREDTDGTYTDHLDLTEPEDYETAFTALLRPGMWYPGKDGFHIASDLYELGSYASGPVDFCVPYESLSGVLDAKWIPSQATGTASIRLEMLTEVPEGSVEILDRVVVGDGGETFLLCFDGEAREITLERTSFSEELFADGQIFYCGVLRDAAIQMAITFAGDLEDILVHYEDEEGFHRYLVSMSGMDGSIIIRPF